MTTSQKGLISSGKRKKRWRVRYKETQEIKAKEFLTVKDTAKLINCSIKSIYRFIDTGKLGAVNLSQRKTMVKREEVDKLFK